MKKFVSKSIDSCLLEASKYFACSITQLDYEVIQNPSGGFFGLGRKEAIIVANYNTGGNAPDDVVNRDSKQQINDESVRQNSYEKNTKNYSPANNIFEGVNHQTSQGQDNIHSYSLDSNTLNQEQNIETKSKISYDFEDGFYRDSQSSELPWNDRITNRTNHTMNETQDSLTETISSHNTRQQDSLDTLDNPTSFTKTASKNKVFSNDIHYERDNQDMIIACETIQKELSALLQLLPLDLRKVEVKPYDNYSVFIFIDGIDAALLIGQKGYRYKSLSYLLFNWVNTCYGYGVRLEIAQFLKNQEETIQVYLNTIIEAAKKQGKAQTKPLDGILTYIALKILKEKLPNKYIALRDTPDGEKYITINDFMNTH